MRIDNEKNNLNPIVREGFELEEWAGKLVPIIYRSKITGKLSRCPFCDKVHGHGFDDGHRIAHCTSGTYYEKVIIQGIEVFQDNGYVLKTKDETRNILPMNKHIYECTITYGNLARIETEMRAKQIKKFLECFDLKNFIMKKEKGSYNDIYYSFKLEAEFSTPRQRDLFAQSLVSFCLFRGAAIYEGEVF